MPARASASAGSGGINGSVTVPSGSAQAICVRVDRRDSLDPHPAGSGRVVAGSPRTTGRYVINGLPAGDYTVHFAACSSTVNWAAHYWPNTPERDHATEVHVVDGALSSGIDTAMVVGGKITGSVTVPAASSANDVCVSAHEGYVIDGDHSADAHAKVTPEGTYTVVGLATGSYEVHFAACIPSANLAPQYWENVAAPSAETFVPVTAGADTLGIDAAMARGGTISGTVTVPVGSAHAVCAAAYGARDDTPGGTATVVAASDKTMGTYAITGLSATSYSVFFSPCKLPSQLVSQAWHNASDSQSTTPVPVTAGGFSDGIDATMTVGGRIRGSITVPTGSAGDVCVDAYAAYAGGAFSDSGTARVVPGSPVTHGTYTVIGLSSGSYSVRFRPCTSEINLLPQSWRNAPDGAAATPVPVTAGATTSGINADMVAGGSITGAVTVPSGTASDVCVYVEGSNGSGFGQVAVSAGSDGTSGTYRIHTLPTGAYLVRFSICRSANLLAQYWPDKPDAAAATRVDVTAGAVSSGIDATMHPGGSISGSVTVPSGSVARVCVAASGDGGGATSVYAGALATAGTYRIERLPTGTYQVEFFPCSGRGDLVTQYWQGTAYRDAETLIEVQAGLTTSGIDADMQDAGSISGSVTVPSGSAGDVCVAVDLGGRRFASTRVVPASAQTSGTYTIAGLPGASYIVSFWKCSDGVVSQYWQHTSDRNAATPVQVVVGATTTGIDATMAAAGAG